MIAQSTPGIVLAAAALLVAACNSDIPTQSPADAPTTVQVLVEPLQYQSFQTRVEAVGTSRAIRSIELHPATSGEVVSVKFEPGQRVSAGDVLVELDSRQEKLAVALADVRLQDAERLFERYQRTGSSGAVLPTDIDAARTAVESARIELDQAKVALEDRTIEAQFAGHVGITEVDPGDRINPDTLITTLDDRSSLLVTFEVPEARVSDIRVGDDVAIASWNSQEPTAYGRVVDIGSRIDPVTRTFVARAQVANETDTLRPGMSFRVSIEVEGTAYPMVAETGVQWGADGAYIWSVVDGRAQRIPVQIMQRQRGRVLVDGDVERGALIVVEGIQRIRDGIDVIYEQPNVADSHPEIINGSVPQGGE
jgi:membrane fusion protein (multidrug efflux system)